MRLMPVFVILVPGFVSCVSGVVSWVSECLGFSLGCLDLSVGCLDLALGYLDLSLVVWSMCRLKSPGSAVPLLPATAPSPKPRTKLHEVGNTL